LIFSLKSSRILFINGNNRLFSYRGKPGVETRISGMVEVRQKQKKEAV